ncbi:MAG: saccharopine dehydrogenase C-terminal domain-containing protein [Bacteroidales bacterium]
MKKIMILGAGLVGRPMALDLADDKDISVTVLDQDPVRLQTFDKKDISTIRTDLNDTGNLKKILDPCDAVISAVPGNMGFKTLQAIIGTGKPVVDISFFPEDMFLLDDLAKTKNITAICDMGVAPGMSNLLVGNGYKHFDRTDSIEIYVGGLPKVRHYPWEYKAVFSPSDVIEEYTRPARFVRNGKLVVKPALSDPALIYFEKPGTLEAFNSDGLRSLIKTLKVPDMIEKTLRYPGHIEKIKVLKKSGFFDTEPVRIGLNDIKPLDFTSQLLFRQWKLARGEQDLTVMKIIISGIRKGTPETWEYNLYDEYDPVSGIHSMARTTGYAATMALRMLLAGKYSNPGINVPEMIPQSDGCVDFILNGLKKRGISYILDIRS